MSKWIAPKVNDTIKDSSTPVSGKAIKNLLEIKSITATTDANGWIRDIPTYRIILYVEFDTANYTNPQFLNPELIVDKKYYKCIDVLGSGTYSYISNSSITYYYIDL